MDLTNYPPGWTCGLIAVRLERYLVRTLARGEALAVAAHVEACVWCAERVVMLRLMTDAGAGSDDRQRTRPVSLRGAATRRRRGKRKSGDHDS